MRPLSHAFLLEHEDTSTHSVVIFIVIIKFYTFGFKSLTTPLAWLVNEIIYVAYFSASSNDIDGNRLNTCPCLLQMTYPSTPFCTLILSMVSSTSLF